MLPRPPTHPARSRFRRRALGGLLLLPGLLVLAAFRPADPGRAFARARVALSGGRLVASGRLALQETPWDCGPTALHNLLLSLGVPTPGPAALARMSGTRPGGTRLGGLVRAAREVGVSLRARRATLDELSAVRAPFLAWYREGHFVTVLEVGASGRVRIHDPGVGGYRLPVRAFRRRWGGVVAEPPPELPEDSSRVPRVGPATRPRSRRR